MHPKPRTLPSIALALAIGLFAATRACALGAEGHQTIGAIADD